MLLGRNRPTNNYKHALVPNPVPCQVLQSCRVLASRDNPDVISKDKDAIEWMPEIFSRMDSNLRFKISLCRTCALGHVHIYV